MGWDDINSYETELKQSLEAFDWPAAEAVCERLVARIKREPDNIPEGQAKSILQRLRRKRRFVLMARLAEAMVQSGQRAPTVRRQYAQALIDQGLLYAAETVSQNILANVGRGASEEAEARGLLGRVYKQLYVNRNDPQSEANQANLVRAVKEYREVFERDPTYVWHGVNAVALLFRARRDEVPVEQMEAAGPMAEYILQLLDQRERESADGLKAWDYATMTEAHLALGHQAEAAAAASRYVMSDDVDAFELASTIRQLTEVWQLTEQEPPGSLLLPICKAAYLKKQGAVMRTDAAQVTKDAAAAAGALESAAGGGGFEKVFGKEMMVTLQWYKEGLAKCDSVARIETLDGKGFGTGWLVEASEFFSDRRGPLLLTNEHVISEDDTTYPYASFPEDAQANFQTAGQVVPVGEIVWSSPRGQLDATFVTLKEEPKAKPLALAERPMRMADPPPRMYVIGHPKGRDIELSLQDNNLLATNERLLHYRTPTEPGNSGSPVFEPKGWRVVGLHHRGNDDMARIDGQPGTYQANEGIAIQAIQQRTREHEGS